MKVIEKEAEMVDGKETSKSNLVSVYSNLAKINHMQDSYLKMLEQDEEEIDLYDMVSVAEAILASSKKVHKESGLLIGISIES